VEATSVEAQDLLRQNANLREQQRAVGGVTRAVTRGEGLQPVLDEIVEAARRLCRGDNAQLYLVDGELLRIAAQTGSLAGVYEYDVERPHRRDRSTVVGRVALTGDVVQIRDVLADPEYFHEAQEIIGFRALLGVPIDLEGALIGVLAVARNEPGEFDGELVELVQTFAAQAAIAIANARLIGASENQLEQQRAISDVLAAVARAEGLESVFEVAIKAATRLCHGDYGAVYLEEGDVLLPTVVHGGSPEQADYERTHPHHKDRRTLVGRVALDREQVHIPDTLTDAEYAWAARDMSGYRALVGVPILIEDEFIGVIGVARNDAKPFNEAEIELLKTFADQASIAIANARLLEAVERQRTELSRFVSPQVSELLTSDRGQQLLAGHRAYITCLFCDLRGFTSFAETAAPEELFEVLRAYHELLGELIAAHEGTLEHFAGDGVMVFFNDPVERNDPELQAVRLAVATQERFVELSKAWRRRGTQLGLGIGIEAGYATLGRIGFEGRYDYGALGPVTNLANRLSSRAEGGQILVGQRVFGAVEDVVDAREVGSLELKGFGRPIAAYEVTALRTPAA
jgi:class 3 adenylate cyclase/putative methionine-R-sulfoxide reductase with GAF domain